MHEHELNDAVHEVLKKLDQKEERAGAARGEQQSAGQPPTQREETRGQGSPSTDQTLRDEPTGQVEEIQQGMRGLDVSAVDPLRVQRSDLMRYSCELTLDTNTMNRNLKLSDNNRKVTLVMKEEQSYPDHPERFDVCPQLLCRDGLTDRCYWEVETSGKVFISVSYRGINRKGNSHDCLLGFNDQSWSLTCSDGFYFVRHNNIVANVSSSPTSGRVAVYVDCPAGSLSFYSVSSDSLIHLYTFNTTFTQTLYPGLGFFSDGSSVSLCPL
ncbi:neoverrucotoxin subunit alpha-like [Perca flavescens]|uniref:neoverrucotoxin subunit alpha-like n=1 Tax=Perca flavescens TaxID=8167 RepID=UPI00106EAC3B|nr:neoverrucotoxin subunit alpha-like [Perca flavescens]